MARTKDAPSPPSSHGMRVASRALAAVQGGACASVVRACTLLVLCLGLLLSGCGRTAALATALGTVALERLPAPRPVAAGASVAPAAARPSPPLHLPMPASVRALYISAWTAGSALPAVIAYLRANRLNAVVIDVKDSGGRLSLPLPGTQAQVLGAGDGAIADPAKLLRTLHSDGIYVIGRVVAFADPFLAAKRPGLALPSHLWGQRWVNAQNPAVQAYNIQIGAAAARLGFDEIQFDDLIVPGAAGGAAVDAFLAAATAKIHRVPVAADVLGSVALATADQGVGQDFTVIAHTVAVVSPYGTGWSTLAAAEARTADLPVGHIRPWIQDGGPAQVDAELRALAAAGIHSFMLWDPGSARPAGVDFGLVRKAPPAVPAPQWLPAAYGLAPSGVPVWLPARVPVAPAYSVTDVADGSGYDAVLWSTPAPLPANDPGAIAGQPLLVISGARIPGDLAPLPAVIPPGAGVRVVWQTGGMAFEVWAPDQASAAAAIDSMRQTQLAEGR